MKKVNLDDFVISEITKSDIYKLGPEFSSYVYRIIQNKKVMDIWCADIDDANFIRECSDELEHDTAAFQKLRPVSIVLVQNIALQMGYNMIQLMDTTSYYHGFQHIINTLKIMERFINALELDDKTADKLLTTLILHDIGRAETGHNHEKESAQFAYEYFCKNDDFIKCVFTSQDRIDIQHAIMNHEAKDDFLYDLSWFDLLVNLADKLDITKDRVNLDNPLNPDLPSYKFDLFRDIYLNVNQVNIDMHDGELLINICGNNNLNTKDLFSIPFMQQVYKISKVLAQKIDTNIKILVNGNEFTMDDNSTKKQKI